MIGQPPGGGVPSGSSSAPLAGRGVPSEPLIQYSTTDPPLTPCQPSGWAVTEITDPAGAAVAGACAVASTAAADTATASVVRAAACSRFIELLLCPDPHVTNLDECTTAARVLDGRRAATGP